MTKRKIKIKWKNILILLLIIALIILPFSITKKEKKETFPQELKKLSKEINYIKEENKERYISYQKTHKDLSTIQVIKDVNMNLDKTPYKYTIEVKDTNNYDILVNKYYYLNENYVPSDLEAIDLEYGLSNMRLRKEAKTSFEELSKAAKDEGYTIIAMSSYRSYSYQVNLYNRYVQEDGLKKADTYSGRPGHSEHQTGLAVDVYNKELDYTKFEETKEYNWMTENAYKYGFILRFPKDKEKETGYQFESWHYRYVGIDTAKYIKEHNITLEEYIATKKNS